MVKRSSSKRAYKKRTYKKRRTARKVRNIKIQKGGIDGTTSIILAIVFGPFMAMIGLDKVLTFLNGLLMFLGKDPMPIPGVQKGGGWMDNLKANVTAAAEKAAPLLAEGKAKAAAAAEQAAPLVAQAKAKAAAAAEKAAPLVAQAKDKAAGFGPIVQSIKAAAPSQLTNITTNLRTIAQSGPSATPGPAVKQRLLDNLNKLKTDLDKEPKTYGPAAACLQKIIERIQNGSINIEKPNQTPEVEPVKNISDIVKEAITTATTAADTQNLDKLNKVKLIFTTTISTVRTELTTKIDKLINSIKLRYNLSPEDIQCFTTLKNALLGAIITKKDAAIAQAIENPKLQVFIKGAAAAGDFAKGLLGRFSSSPVASAQQPVQPAQPVQQSDEGKRAALKAANATTIKVYNDAKALRITASTAETSAQKDALATGMTTSSEDKLKLINNYAAKKEAANAARKTSSDAYQRAFDAAKAAVAGGVPESEVKYPVV
jgi:hypothetical protein